MEIFGFYIDFRELLVLIAISTTLFFPIVYMRSREDLLVRSNERLGRTSYMVVISIFIVLVFYSLIIGYRPYIYFLYTGLILVPFLVLGRRSIDKYFQNINPVLLMLLLLSFTEPLILLFGNRFYPLVDWSRDSIFVTGSLAEYQREQIAAGLYYLIPVRWLGEIMLVRLTFPDQIIRLIYMLAVDTALVLSFYYFFIRLGYDRLTGILALLFFWSNPGNSFTMGRLVTEAYPFLYIFLLVLYVSTKIRTPNLLLLTIIGIPMIFAHGSPFVSIILIFVPLILITHIRSRARIIRVEPDWARAKSPLLILSIVTLLYWGWTHIIRSIARLGTKLLDSLTQYFAGIMGEGVGATTGWAYTPRYCLRGLEIYAYAWAFPIGLAGGYALYFMLRRRFNKIDNGLAEVTAILGGGVVAISYISYTIGEAGQYWIPVGYFITLIASIIAARRALSVDNKVLFTTVLVLISLFVAIGTSSPTHAPLEHPEFESIAYKFRYTRYIEVSVVGNHIPRFVTIYFDYDFPVRGGIYKGIREKLYQLMSGTDPYEFYKYPYTLIALKNERFVGTMINIYVADLVYRSDYYTIMGIGE